MNRKLILQFCFALVSVCANQVAADISLPTLFADHMVLQRNSTLRLWGTATPEEKLTIKFADQNTSAVANKDGQWSTQISVGKAGGPYDLKIASKSKGGAKIVVKDILIGEVWICCGQDNMHQPVAALEDSESHIDDAKNYPLLRFFKVEDYQSSQPLDDFAKVNPWLCCSTDSIKNFSALGYLFGKKLADKLKIPIGLIDVSRLGTTLESWTPYDALEDDKSFSGLLTYWKDSNDPGSEFRPASNYNGMVSPLVSFPVAGVVWAQGEANVGRGAQYAKMFPTMIESWREKFKAPRLPFYIVQPAPFRYESLTIEALPEIWDAQLRTFKKTEGTGLFVTSDLANTYDIKIANPEKLAKRIADWAAYCCYPKTRNENQTEKGSEGGDRDSQGRQEILLGPIFDDFVIRENKIEIGFKFADNGLILHDTEETGFTICGSDKTFRPAVAKIQGSKVILSNPDIKSPIAVRYGWNDTAKPNLTNSEGLPASTFRTDDFPLASVGVEF